MRRATGPFRNRASSSNIWRSIIRARSKLVPADADLARRTRLSDRFFDLYVNVQVGKIVTDRLRPAGKNDSMAWRRRRRC